MTKKRTTKGRQSDIKAKRATPAAKRRASPTDYADVLADMKRLIVDSRYRALATVNRELVCLYWHIGRVIVQQQETANWGDSVVEQLATDLRASFPDMKGLSLPNIWKMRQWFVSCGEIDRWLQADNCSIARKNSRQCREF